MVKPPNPQSQCHDRLHGRVFLSLAPAHLLAQLADLADLDGPLWLSEDRPDKLAFDGLRLLRPRLPLG
ncbi:MAG: hypothetical protein CM15mP21_8310 [Hyphomicrobiales bacterium]|nr:MAG: hypothetical protein CM15mP21_8310 [Hyphomicrobiales bacterium]